MVSPSKVEVIKHAVKQVMQEVGPSGNKTSYDDDHDDGDEKHDHRILSKLLSQLDNLEREPEEPESAINGDLTKMKDINIAKSKEEDDDEKAKILKELNELKRQNFITQCLLSAMIVLTVTWQISEVSIILKLKDGVTHPFRSIGGMFMSMIRPPKAIDNDEDTGSSITSNLASNLIESSPVHDLKIPELPRIDLPKLDFGLNLED